MEIYEVLIDEEKWESGVNAISLVDSPAIDSNWIALSKDETKIHLTEVDAEKKILMGAVLIPNKPIYRDQDGNQFYIVFSKETIRKASELFFIRGNQSETTLGHQHDLSGNTVVESWIKEDMEKDKTALHSLHDIPLGSWVVSMKISDPALYEEAKNGTLKGFSIEGFFNPDLRENITLKKDTDETSSIDEIIKINKIRNLVKDA